MAMRLRAASLSGAAKTNSATTAAATADSTTDTFYDYAGNRLYTREDVESVAMLAKSEAEKEVKRIATHTQNRLEEAKINYEKRAANFVSQLKTQLAQKGVEVVVNTSMKEQETDTTNGDEGDVEMADGVPEDENVAEAQGHALKERARRKSHGSEGSHERTITRSRSRSQSGQKSVD